MARTTRAMSHRAPSRRGPATALSRRSAIALTLVVAVLLTGGGVALQRTLAGDPAVLIPSAQQVFGTAQRVTSPLPTVTVAPMRVSGASSAAAAPDGNSGNRIGSETAAELRAGDDMRAAGSQDRSPATDMPGTSAPPPAPTEVTAAAPRATTAPPTVPSTTPPATKPASVAPPTRAPSTGAFPNQSTTGVPAGTALSPYTGPCTITTGGAVIEAKTIGCDLVIRAGGVEIRRSKLTGTIDIEDSGASVTVSDTEIDGGTAHRAAIGYGNITVLRSHIYGAQHGVNCTGNCHVEDSYIHGQYVPPGGDWHLQPFLSNGASNVTLIHNTLSCTASNTSAGGGCTANVSIFGDFQGNHNYTIDNNLMIASQSVGYCVYGGTDDKKPYGRDVSGIRYTNNVFQRGDNGKCGVWGPVTAFVGGNGSVWQNNTWEDGTPVTP